MRFYVAFFTMGRYNRVKQTYSKKAGACVAGLLICMALQTLQLVATIYATAITASYRYTLTAVVLLAGKKFNNRTKTQ
jgi:hypothetical protein